MGQPAARVGDLTVHGGVIAPPGCPLVLIGGLPAARVSHRVDRSVIRPVL
jgi:uncharacterized Zn-binding protein involved in type VI secretion